MLIKLRCESCLGKISAEEELIGMTVNCPACSSVLQIPVPHFAFGQIVGAYEIERWLGAGETGEDYLAWQVATNRQVVIKLIPNELIDEDVESLLVQLKELVKLNHKNLLPVFDCGQIIGFCYVVVAYVDGETLEEKLLRNGVFQPQEVVKIGCDILRTLRYCWETLGVYHGVIKPSSILLEKDGGVRIVDTGLHKMASVREARSPYSSPEQIDDLEHISIHSDVFSLGALMYQLLTGVMPFENEFTAYFEPRNPQELVPQIAEGVADLVLAMLAYEPAGRFDEITGLEQRFLSLMS